MRKYIALISLLCVISSAVCGQHSLDKLLMKVTLKKDGSARIIERRDVQVGTEGTEGFITFNNMDNMKVCNLKVFDDTDTEYVVEDEWDIDRSRADKKGRCGYHRTGKGVELCWGIGDAGKRTYYICYTVTNLVKAYTDYDGFCHSFYEASNSPAQKAFVTIAYEEDSLTRENTGIWAFGYYGYKGFDEGTCIASNDSPMRNGDRIIIMLQLNKGLFEPALKLDASFKETVKRKALEGSDYNLEDAGLGDAVSPQPGNGVPRHDDVAPEPSGPDWGLLGGSLVIIGIVVAAFMVTKRDKKRQKQEEERVRALVSGLTDGKKLNEVPYWRNLPLGGNLLLSGVILDTLNTYSYSYGGETLDLTYNMQHMFEAFVLRMIYRKKISITVDEADGKVRKLFHVSEPVKPEKGEDIKDMLVHNRYSRTYELPGNKAIKISQWRETEENFKGYLNDAGIEYHLQKLLYDAAAEDHVLQPDELSDYIKENPMQWRPFANMLNRLTGGILDEKLLNRENAMQVVGFLRYLKDFSLVGERYIEEVALWKEYLVFASFYGIADQVRKDMKKIAPDVAELNDMIGAEQLFEDIAPLTDTITSSLLFAHSYMTYKEQKEVEEYERERERRERRSSSGDDGYSSYGGGGGHSGGGGSGFR